MLIIGICGGSASGKTTLAELLQKNHKNEVALLHQDCYYRKNDGLTLSERLKINYDMPEAIETELLIKHIEELSKGNEIFAPVYDFSSHNRTKETIKIEPKKVLIVEGILLFENEKLRELFDKRVFVQSDEDIRVIRKIRRDIAERGRNLDFIIDQYLTKVKPMHEKYVEPLKKYADLVISGNENNQSDIEKIEKIISEYLMEVKV